MTDGETTESNAQLDAIMTGQFSQLMGLSLWSEQGWTKITYFQSNVCLGQEEAVAKA